MQVFQGGCCLCVPLRRLFPVLPDLAGPAPARPAVAPSHCQSVVFRLSADSDPSISFLIVRVWGRSWFTWSLPYIVLPVARRLSVVRLRKNGWNFGGLPVHLQPVQSAVFRGIAIPKLTRSVAAIPKKKGRER